MFVARAGLTGRGLRQGRAHQSGIVALLGPKKKKNRGKFRCWVPFMLRPCIAGSVGLFILLGGAAMCTVGFFAEEFSMLKLTNTTSGEPYIKMQEDKRWHLHNLTYGGPVMMGIGCFIIVISCVVVCEERDKMIKIMIEEEEKKKKKKGYKPPPKKENIIERLVLRIKQCTEGVLPTERMEVSDVEKSNISDESEKEKPGKFRIPCTGEHKDENSDKSYSHIKGALFNIPANIFTVDIEERKTSLIPVNVAIENPKPISEQIKEHYNRIENVPPPRSKSAPCLYDLKKYKEGNMGQIYLPHEELFHQVKAELIAKRSLPAAEINGREQEVNKHVDDMDDVSDSDDSACGEAEHRNLGFSSDEFSFSEEGVDDLESDSDFMQATCDTKDTYMSLRLEEGEGSVAERGESRASNSGNRHKIIVHQVSVHSAGDGDDVHMSNAGYKPRNTSSNAKVEELTHGVARANAMGMDRFRVKKGDSESSLTSASSDHVYMSESMVQELNFKDDIPKHAAKSKQLPDTSSRLEKYAVNTSPVKSYGSQAAVCDTTINPS